MLRPQPTSRHVLVQYTIATPSSDTPAGLSSVGMKRSAEEAAREECHSPLLLNEGKSHSQPGLLQFFTNHARIASTTLAVGRKMQHLIGVDARFIALVLVRQLLATFPNEVCGPRSRAVCIASCLFIAWKYTHRDTDLEKLLEEAGFNDATVRKSDVFELELKVLSAANFHVAPPAWIVAALTAANETFPSDLSNATARVLLTSSFADRVVLHCVHHKELAVFLDVLDPKIFGGACAVASCVTSVAVAAHVVGADEQTLRNAVAHLSISCI